MALALNDRVQQTGTANTTISFTLSGSVTGFQSFAVIGNTNTTYYSATDSSGNWEVGVGTYTTAGTLLTRTTILSSSNSGSAVTFSGTVNVIVTYPSEKSVNLDGSGNVVVAGTISGAELIASNGIFVNNNTIAITYSIPSGSSAMSAGPITINSGVSVTIPTGSRWVVL